MNWTTKAVIKWSLVNDKRNKWKPKATNWTLGKELQEINSWKTLHIPKKKKKYTTWRPTKMTENTLQKLEFAFMAWCTDLEACLYADISDWTLYNYQNEQPSFLDRKKLLKSNVRLQARINVVNSVYENNIEDSKWMLERVAKDEFSRQVNQEITWPWWWPITIKQIMEWIVSQNFDEDNIKNAKHLTQ